MEKKFTKQQVREKELVILFSIFLFLLFAYISGNFKWIGDFQLVIDLFSSVFAFFIGILALLRFYTKKTYINYLLLGLGFITVSILDGFHVLNSVDAFSGLFSMQVSEIFPSSMVLSRVFLSLIFFLSWFLMKEESKVRKLKERVAFASLLIAISLFVGSISIFTNLFVGLESYMFAIVMQTVALIIYALTLVGYTREEGMYHRNFDFWLIFSITFGILSQIFFLPYLNIEYELMLNLSTLAKFISYFVLLMGFLFSIYEMYKSEEKIQNELKKKNLLLSMTKRKVEEAYMILREEKWKISKEQKKKTTDKIFKDILKK